MLQLSWQRICLQWRRPWFNPWVRKICWRRKLLPSPVFWPGEFHVQRSLAGYSPWGHKELTRLSDFQFHAFHTIFFIPALSHVQICEIKQSKTEIVNIRYLKPKFIVLEIDSIHWMPPMCKNWAKLFFFL